tara:strand:- start:29 stop:277 length:249 start_codon:yes stop_codon:yes gene_type:complete
MSFTKFLESNNIVGYHSGGGCIHLLYKDTNGEQWLINPYDESIDDFVNQYPSYQDQVCIFGNNDGATFKATLKEGINELKSM